MLNRLFSRLRGTPANRPAPKTRPRGLTLETLEGRDVPSTIYALGATATPAANNLLLRFDSATPGNVTTTPITGLVAGDALQGIDYRPRTGQLVGIAFPAGSTGNNTANSYSINPLTAVATLLVTNSTITNGNDTFSSDLDFNPTVDRLRYVNEGLTNVRINVNSSTLAGTDTNISPNTTIIIGAAYDRNFDRQSVTPASTGFVPTTLYAIDRVTGTLGTIGGINGTPSPNGGVFTPIGALGVTLTGTDEGGFDILTSTTGPNNGGNGIAYAALSVAGVTRLYTINLTTGAATAVGLIGAGTTEVYDLAAVPNSTVVVGSGLGANGDVRLYDSQTGTLQQAIVPFQGFQGGVRVAAGDVTGDGVPDAIVTAVESNNGHVKVFNGATGAQVVGTIGSFLAPYPGFTGSVNVAAGDVNGDGFADVILVAVATNGHVKVLSGNPADNARELASFLSYAGFQGSVSVSAADFNNDGRDEIVTVANINGHVKVFNADGTAFTANGGALSSFLAFDGAGPIAVSVAAGDVNGDGIADIVVASGASTRGHVRAFSGRDQTSLASFFAFEATFTGGAFVGLADANSDGLLDIRVTPGFGGQPPAVPNGTKQAAIFTFSLSGAQLVAPLTTFSTFLGGSTIGGARY